MLANFLLENQALEGVFLHGSKIGHFSCIKKEKNFRIAQFVNESTIG